MRRAPRPVIGAGQRASSRRQAALGRSSSALHPRRPGLEPWRTNRSSPALGRRRAAPCCSAVFKSPDLMAVLMRPRTASTDLSPVLSCGLHLHHRLGAVEHLAHEAARFVAVVLLDGLLRCLGELALKRGERGDAGFLVNRQLRDRQFAGRQRARPPQAPRGTAVRRQRRASNSSMQASGKPCGHRPAFRFARASASVARAPWKPRRC